MNLLLLFPEDLEPDGTALLRGRREKHAREVLRASPGEQLRVGLLGGEVGLGEVLEARPGELRLRLGLTSPPPPRPGIDLLLAIPRPKALKKVLPAVASLGVDRIVLVNAARVEKSYFDSKVLEGEFVRDLLLQGLEQARDTVLPEVIVRDRFRPFVEDELDAMFPDSRRVVPHPVAEHALVGLDLRPDRRLLLAVGPDGGWVPFEVELLRAQGFVPASLGPRILRVEVAVPYVLGMTAAVRSVRSP